MDNVFHIGKLIIGLKGTTVHFTLAEREFTFKNGNTDTSIKGVSQLQEYVDKLMHGCKRLRPKRVNNLTGTKEYITLPIKSSLAVEIITDLPLGKITSIGIIDRELKSVVSIQIEDKEVEVVDLFDGYTQRINKYATNELANEAFMNACCEYISCCSTEVNLDSLYATV